METYDVVVIGGGAGGVPAAVRVSQLGGRAALIEHRFLGGICMNRGCIPYGHMMAAAGRLGNLALAREMGLGLGRGPVDYARLIRRQRDLIAFMRQGVKTTLRKNRVEVFRGRGRLLGRGRVGVDGEVLAAKNVILAAGVEWLRPDFPGADLKGVCTTDGLLVVEALPASVLVCDRSPRVIEAAQFLHRFGSEVVLATEEGALLADESRAVRSRLARALKQEGLRIRTKAEIRDLRPEGQRLRCRLLSREGEESLLVDRVMTFRRGASFEGLGLERVGLAPEKGFLRVNERMETAAEGVYAVGDLTAPESGRHSHAASAGGIVAAENAMGLRAALDRRSACRVLFTQPQVACVGLTAKGAKEAGYEVVTGAAPLSMNPLGMLTAQGEGLIEIVADRTYGELLGVSILGEGAAELAGQAVLAIQMEATIGTLARTPFPHPTLGESLAEAARDCLGRAIYLP